MKRVSILFLVVSFLWCTNSHAKDIKSMVEIIKNPIEIESSTSPKLNVKFMHTDHKGLNCLICHHEVSKKGRYVPCVTCHHFEGRKNKEPIGMYSAFHAKDSGRSCFGCHLKLAANEDSKYFNKFRSCRPCHMGPISRAEREANAKK
ncbi:MAG: cytochrome c3 family protein [Desulfovibrio sp.]|nr:cytochrome c3 family protein [Desulfovibrio sp.]